MVEPGQDIFNWGEDPREDSIFDSGLSLGRENLKKVDSFFKGDVEESIPNEKNTFSLENKMLIYDHESYEPSQFILLSLPKGI